MLSPCGPGVVSLHASASRSKWRGCDDPVRCRNRSSAQSAAVRIRATSPAGRYGSTSTTCRSRSARSATSGSSRATSRRRPQPRTPYSPEPPMRSQGRRYCCRYQRHAREVRRPNRCGNRVRCRVRSRLRPAARLAARQEVGSSRRPLSGDDFPGLGTRTFHPRAPPVQMPSSRPTGVWSPRWAIRWRWTCWRFRVTLTLVGRGCGASRDCG
jgi:hypothetical protein